MAKYKIYENLTRLNHLPAVQAEALFRSCCGSERWVRTMIESRPYAMLEDLYSRAETAWFALPPSDQLEAYSTLPLSTHEEKQADLEKLKTLYREKFGFIFVLAETGKPAGEVLAIAKARLRNSPQTEISIAAREHVRIIQEKLNFLLER